MSSNAESGRRLSITNRQLAEAAGAELLKLLSTITADGKIGLGEVQQLRDWLFSHAGVDLPAVTYLTRIVVRILAVGVITGSEETGLYLAIEQVLPMSERELARQAREDAEAQAEAEAEIQAKPSIPGDRITGEDLERMKVPTVSAEDNDEKSPGKNRARGDWRNNPITEPQVHYIKALGGSIHADATKGEAAGLIDQLLKKKPPSSRQQMVLRFWGKSVDPEAGPRETVEWMDQFYTEDPDRKAAWELFKQESEDDGLQGDPTRVPIGVGPAYLARIKTGHASPRFKTAGTRDPHSREPAAAGPGVPVLVWILGAGVAAVIIFFVTRPTSTTAAAAPGPVQAAALVAPAATAKPSALAPRANEPTPAEISMAEMRGFARSMHFTGIILFAGQTGAMIDGQRVRLGEKLGPAGGYTLAKINAIERSITLRDRFGNTVAKAVE